jgi:hypothetical protein
MLLSQRGWVGSAAIEPASSRSGLRPDGLPPQRAIKGVVAIVAAQ